MGVIGRILGTGAAARGIEAVGGVAEVFVGNRAGRESVAGRVATAALDQFGAEFARAGVGRWDSFVNGLNRLPRPLLALSTLGLFAYAMVEPGGFGTRMRSLALVPEPLWWLLGAIVSFYFGARELHHQRTRTLIGLGSAPIPAPAAAAPQPAAPQPIARLAAVPAAIDPDHNAAVEDWRRSRG